jgi:molybdopterin molybdotransferase
MLSPQDAWNRLEAHLQPCAIELLARRRALGRVLAEPVRATLDVPAADVSAMDGFAVAGAPGEALPVAGRIVAGDAPGRVLAAGTALRIMTGAPIPAGADRVLPVEVAKLDHQGRVLFGANGEPGDHIRRRGEIVRAGAPLVAAGTQLLPGTLAVLATHGLAELPVVGLPRVAVLVTGDEVVPPDQAPAPGQLRDSHGDFLLAAVGELGNTVVHHGIAPDDPAALRARMVAALADSDILLTTGGVSMGELDHVESVLAELEFESLVTAVAIQPGKPFVAARRGDGKWVFGLPGNPASVMVSFWLFVRPVLRRLGGSEDGFWHGALAARLAAAAPGAGPRDRFLPASVQAVAGELRVTAHPPRGSHDLDAYGRGTALLRISAGAAPAPVGAPCEVLPLVDWRLGGGAP